MCRRRSRVGEGRGRAAAGVAAAEGAQRDCGAPIERACRCRHGGSRSEPARKPGRRRCGGGFCRSSAASPIIEVRSTRRVTKTTKRDGFVIENVIFESLPDYYVTANLYRPDREGRHPAVLMSMGHWEAGKPAGQLLSANLARKGFVVLAYDPVGQGERQQAYDPRMGRSLIGGATEQHFSNGAAAILMGQSVARYFIFDGMRSHRLPGQPPGGGSRAHRRDRLFRRRHPDDLHRGAGPEGESRRGQLLHEFVPDALSGSLPRRLRAEPPRVSRRRARPDRLRRAVRAQAVADLVNRKRLLHAGRRAAGRRGSTALVQDVRCRKIASAGSWARAGTARRSSCAKRSTGG